MIQFSAIKIVFHKFALHDIIDDSKLSVIQWQLNECTMCHCRECIIVVSLAVSFKCCLLWCVSSFLGMALTHRMYLDWPVSLPRVRRAERSASVRTQIGYRLAGQARMYPIYIRKILMNLGILATKNVAVASQTTCSVCLYEKCHLSDLAFLWWVYSMVLYQQN